MPAILLKRRVLSRTKIVHSGFWVNTVRVEFDTSIGGEALQPGPVVQRIVDRLRGVPASGQFRELRLEPDTQPTSNGWLSA